MILLTIYLKGSDSVMQFLKKNWYWAIVISILFMEFLVFAISGESHTYIGIHETQPKGNSPYYATV